MDRSTHGPFYTWTILHMDHSTHGPFYTSDGDKINTEQLAGTFPTMMSIRLFVIETLTAVPMWTAYDYPRLPTTTQRLPKDYSHPRLLKTVYKCRVNRHHINSNAPRQRNLSIKNLAMIMDISYLQKDI